ncbi:MAG: hypothetical protein HYY16_11955 [Planctomycetes bacterium]|nr:hypothetical protein [Planctomycetota bacterium]
MARTFLKLGVGSAAIGVLAAILVVLAVGARLKGKLSHCRNNMRYLGVLARKELMSAPDQPPEERGRAFWQWVREQQYHNPRDQTWVLKGALNPFGCPVRGRAPLDLTSLSRQEYAKIMSDPSTIDYRGPKSLPDPLEGNVMLGADREGNHPSGGHVLMADLSVSEKQQSGIQVHASEEMWRRAGVETRD